MYTITIKNGSTESVLHEPGRDSLRRCLSGKYKGRVNEIPSFRCSINSMNPCYSLISERSTTLTLRNNLTETDEFEGEVLLTQAAMTGAFRKELICQGFLGYLGDTVQVYRHYDNASPEEFLTALLENHNAQTSSGKRIYMGQCNVAGNRHSKTTACRTTLEEIRENLIARLGGEIRVRRTDGVLYLDYLRQIGEISSAQFTLGENLRSLTVQTDGSALVTRLIPLGCKIGDDSAERLTIESVNGGVPYIDDAAALALTHGRIITGTVVWDDITVPANLLAAGQEWLRSSNRIRRAYQAQVLDLSPLDRQYAPIREGNTYRFVCPPMGIGEDLRIVGRTLDIYKPQVPAIEIGDKLIRLTDMTAGKR